jgi:O-antigen ligase
MSDLWMHRNRGAGDPRLVGPFGTPGITAAYFMTMTVWLAYEILHAHTRRRIALAMLACANVAMIMGTASRGSFLVLIASMLGFLYLFRAELGVLRAIRILVASVIIVAAAGFVVVSHTEFGNMFSRLEHVGNLEGGIPDTRSRVWPAATEKIPDRLWLGHGPYLMQSRALQRSGPDVHPDQLSMPYPHNLYLHLLLTLGIVGTAAVLYFFLLATWRIYRGTKEGSFASEYERGLLVLGTLLALGFFADQMKIEFLRHATIDYVHFVFGLFGIFLGISDRGRASRMAERIKSSAGVPASRMKAPARAPGTSFSKAT